MPTRVGPNTFGEENLVFGYDLGDVSNSYKGEPTTNLVEYSEQQNRADYYTEALPGWDTHEGSFIVDPTNKIPGYTNRSIKMTCVNANVYKSHFGNTLTNGQTYTVSFWAKGNTAGTYGNLMLGEGMWGEGGGYISIEPPGGTALTTEFQRYKYTFTLSYPTGYYYFSTYLYIDGQVVWLTGFQLENKEHATQYLPCNGATTTRSATQGLIDLTGNSTIDLTNVSFDSNAQIEFDGSDDYITLPHANSPITNLTYELVVRIDSIPASNTYRSIWQKSANWNGDTGISMQMIYGNLTFSYGNSWGGTVQYPLSNLTAGNRYHIVGTADSTSGADVRFYINGVLVDTGTSYQTPTTTSNLTIGLGNGGTLDGKIDVFKMYSRTLTASEIKANYNAIKGRFNI